MYSFEPLFKIKLEVEALEDEFDITEDEELDGCRVTEVFG